MRGATSTGAIGSPARQHSSVDAAAKPRRVFMMSARQYAGMAPDVHSREVDSMAAPQPSIGDWYRQKEGGALFEVVALDDDDGTIEIQYFDGTVEEMDVEDWQAQW